MHAPTIFKRVMALLVVGVVSACSSASTLTVTQPKTQSIPPGQTVFLSVELDVAEPLPVHQEVATRIRKRLSGRLISDRIFTAVVPIPEPADYRMDVEIRGARLVSTGRRIWLAGMIGPDTVAVAVTVRHQATHQIITAFEATGTSAEAMETSAASLSSEAGLDNAVRAAVAKIIEALR